MGTDNCTFGPGMLYMMDNQERVSMSTPIYDMSCDVPMSADAEVDYNFEFRAPLVQEFTADSCIVDTGLLNLISEQPKGFFLEYDADIQVQARKHRKKRINKKWLKRYGYKTVRRRVRLKCEELLMNREGDWSSVNVTASEVNYL